MTDQISAKQHGGRGPTKPFPTVPLEEALLLPKSILEHGVNGKIGRQTLFSKLGRSPNSGPTRALITNSSKYGLTIGSYAAELLTVTDDGRAMLKPGLSSEETQQKQFDLAIRQFAPFNELYEKLKDQRLPDEAVLKDELGLVGVVDADRQKAAEVFTANIRFLDLLENVGGDDIVRSVGELVDELPAPPSEETSNGEMPPAGIPPVVPSVGAVVGSAVTASEPSVHIDVQIHIDSTASPEQIDQIFASMARHLYRRGS